MVNLTRAEQETVINCTADMDTAEVYTCDPVWMRKMDKLCASRPDVFSLAHDDGVSKTYLCPKKCVRMNAPRRVSESQREHLRQIAKGRKA